MMPLGRWLDRLGFLGLSGGVLAFGFLQGFVPLSLRIEAAFGVVSIALRQATFSSLMFSMFILLSGGILLAQLMRSDGQPAPPTTGNTVTAIVPVYRDANVLSRSVRRLTASIYEDLQVVIVTKEDDVSSRKRAEELANLAGVHHLVNTRYPGSKAGAINYAAEVTESSYIAVFDADEAVHPQYIAEAVAHLGKYDIVQGRTVPQPTGMIEAIAYYESLLLSYSARRLLYLFTGFRMAASRAIVMRRSAFKSVGGYDSTMLTEDFDFAYRCYTERLSVVEHLANPSRIEGPHTLRDWWGQRKRWMTGYVQVLYKLLGQLDPTDRRSVLGAAICAGTVIGPALLLSILSKIGVLFVVNTKEAVLLSLVSGFSVQYVVSAQHIFIVPVMSVIVATAWIHFYDWLTDAVETFDWRWVFVPLLFPLYGLAALKAIFEYPLSWTGDWYTVEKDPERF